MAMTKEEVKNYEGIIYFGGIRCHVKSGKATFSYDKWAKSWTHFTKKYVTRLIRYNGYRWYIRHNFCDYYMN